ncbi:hypothetical protein PC120_g5650 [Phytophthora cactorum]|nr:hypothetical protein PC120_g5650 [Phytophthora cactorum]
MIRTSKMTTSSVTIVITIAKMKRMQGVIHAYDLVHHCEEAEIPLGTFTLPVDTASDDLDLVHAHQLIVIGMRARPDALRYQRTPVAVRGPQPDPRADTVAIATGHLLHLQLVGNTPARVLDLATVTSQAYCVIRENT